jgi:hypothetical protein
MSAELKITEKWDFRKLEKMNSIIFKKALKKGAIQLLDWSANGSSKVPDKPPTRWGILKGSGSAFVGGELVGTTTGTNPPNQGTATPNKSYNGKNNFITIGYNTNYAAKQHEMKLNPGDASRAAGNSNPGNQWLDKHLKGDGSLLMETIGLMMKNEMKK